MKTRVEAKSDCMVSKIVRLPWRLILGNMILLIALSLTPKSQAGMAVGALWGAGTDEEGTPVRGGAIHFRSVSEVVQRRFYSDGNYYVDLLAGNGYRIDAYPDVCDTCFELEPAHYEDVAVVADGFTRRNIVFRFKRDFSVKDGPADFSMNRHVGSSRTIEITGRGLQNVQSAEIRTPWVRPSTGQKYMLTYPQCIRAMLGKVKTIGRDFRGAVQALPIRIEVVGTQCAGSVGEDSHSIYMRPGVLTLRSQNQRFKELNLHERYFWLRITPPTMTTTKTTLRSGNAELSSFDTRGDEQSIDEPRQIAVSAVSSPVINLSASRRVDSLTVEGKNLHLAVDGTVFRNGEEASGEVELAFVHQSASKIRIQLLAKELAETAQEYEVLLFDGSSEFRLPVSVRTGQARE